MPTLWLNGSFLDDATPSISPRDTGLLHAAGLFTTMRSYNQKVFRLPAHLSRLRASAQALSIPFPHTDQEIESAISTLHERNHLTDARLRLTLTRGHAPSPLPHPPASPSLQPTALLTATDLTPYPEEFYERGLTAAVEDQFKLNPYDPQAGHKTLNYFSRLHSLRTANSRGAGESLLFDVHHHLQSGAISNIFLIKNDQLLTPPTRPEIDANPSGFPYPRSSVLPGITRAVVFELAAHLNIPITPTALDLDTLLSADEAFLTNSIMGLMPLCRIERHPLGQDKPGPLTLQLMHSYAHLVQQESTPTP